MVKNLSFKLLAFAFVALTSCDEAVTEKHASSTSHLNFPLQIGPKTPYDVDIELEKKLLKQNEIAEAQRLFDILSWQMFVSLNWPRDASGNPMAEISDNGQPVWESWKESFEIFKSDGSAPEKDVRTKVLPEAIRQKVEAEKKVLFRTSKFADFHGDTADEINQAFTAPIWDQNGKLVRYEIRLNKKMTDYLIDNKLYNLDGQIEFSNAGKKVKFPAGSREEEGAMEVKVAWKIMNPDSDDYSRYYVTEANVMNQDGSFSHATVGMVGMHIATKTESSPQWIWATFEHVDNLETNPLEKVKGKNLKPSFYDPDCSTCPVNTFPDTSAALVKNQIQRVLPINKATANLNEQVRNLLAEKKSPFQYYQLIGTQWPTDPSSPPYMSGNDTSVYSLPAAITNKSGGKPVPTYLTNMIMETYFQGGTIITDSVIAYNKFLGNEAASFQIQGFPTNDMANTQKLVFGTESCVGCHFSASIAIRDTVVKGKRQAIFGKPGNGDFEWLMQLKAKFEQK